MIHSETVHVCKDTQRIPACWSSTEAPHSRHQAAGSTRMRLTAFSSSLSSLPFHSLSLFWFYACSFQQSITTCILASDSVPQEASLLTVGLLSYKR